MTADGMWKWGNSQETILEGKCILDFQGLVKSQNHLFKTATLVIHT